VSTPRAPLFDVAGRVAVVTGGAGRLGARFSTALAEAGATVVVASRDGARRAALVDQLVAAGAEAFGVALDVASEDSVAAAVEAVLARYGRVDVLVNNAGIATPAPVEELSAAEWDRVMAVNARGPFLCAKAFGAPMVAKGSGSIINIASIYGVVAADQRMYGTTGRNSSLVYAASKAALIQMTRYLAAYWADKGVRVNCISPGGVFNDQEPDFLARYAARVPMGRMAHRDEISAAVVFLASDAASYLMGQNLVIDGGLTLW
jgi:NAD(P)-dependent dehydrogenase (short-subunit alcohol dehydrogenase family)